MFAKKILTTLLLIPLLCTAKPMPSSEVEDIATQAYIFGYPLILMELTKKSMTNTIQAGQQKAPINQFAHMLTFPDAHFNYIVRPNADTLYSAAWVNLKDEPIILHVPNTKGRYYLMPMLDMYTNVFASPGKRTTGTVAQNFLLMSSEWRTELPEKVRDLEKIISPTNSMWILGRTQTNGAADFHAVNDLQEQYRLIPLRKFGKPYTPPRGKVQNKPISSQAPADQVEHMDAPTFFTRLSQLMQAYPPAPEDAKIVAQFKKIGLVAGKPFKQKDAELLERAKARALTNIKKYMLSKKGDLHNGWLFQTTNIGTYGTDYLARAATAYFGFGANIPADAVYPIAFIDATHKPFSGLYNYQIHFDKNEIPPVNAFWSLSMYNAQQFFVPNSINRYAIGDRDKLTFNEDDSLDLYIQHESPGKEKESNWLPAPAETFNLTLRLYWPKKEVLDGTWQPPAVIIQPLVFSSDIYAEN